MNRPWQPGDPLHPRHPGIGCSTSLIRLEADEPEVGGVLVFFPSGRTKVVHWRAVKAISPVLEAAKQYTADLAGALMKEGAEVDLRETNWTSVAAAMQRVILDYNDRLHYAVQRKMDAAILGPDGKPWQ